MSVFVDTGVFYADHDVDATRHEAARTALETVLTVPDYGRVVTSEYVLDEAVTLTLSRTGDATAAVELGRRILGVDPYPDAIQRVYAGPETIERAVETMDRYDDHRLSCTDAVSIVQMQREQLDGVLSFDDDFDGIVDRLDPVAVAD